jgi:beta-xylosidase
MNNMNSRFFDVDNYLITAPDIYGSWSEPVYIHSAGFDPSLLHDEKEKNGFYLWSGRPFLPEFRCTLGCKTCMQNMYWTEDG